MVFYNRKPCGLVYSRRRPCGLLVEDIEVFYCGRPSAIVEYIVSSIAEDLMDFYSTVVDLVVFYCKIPSGLLS